MDGEQVFIQRVKHWAHEQNCTFVMGDTDSPKATISWTAWLRSAFWAGCCQKV